MKLALAICMVVACSGAREQRGAEQVPSAWQDVRASAGHTVHVMRNQLACVECHGESFGKPPAELCERCHSNVRATLHPVDPLGARHVPACQDCHGFGTDPAIRPASCMRCHTEPQGKHAAVGAHGDQACGSCHRAHATPSLEPPACTTCHADQKTQHGGARGCLDCHSMHEASTAADAGCASCHAGLRGAKHVDPKAVAGSHRQCTSCHTPHAFGKADVRACTSCHTKPVIAPAKHPTCFTCHAQHDTAAPPRACTTCHAQQVAHPPTARNQP
ncbi:MAG: hypothetical protein ABI867_43205, partial [Kofleriaceae bacterium]